MLKAKGLHPPYGIRGWTAQASCMKPDREN